jgi:circadian clock protein KaiC
MEVMKMRGQSTLAGLHTFHIDQSGLEVYPPARGASQTNTEMNAVLKAPRLQMGVPRLDDMMGGGLPRGYSLLVAGPSGSGKSMLAAAFLAEGARTGESGVMVAFEQHPNRSRSRIVAELINSGQVGLIDNRAADVSIDEIVALLMREIQRKKATRVVIDSLSGFELALAPTFREDFRESLSNLVTALAGSGVTVLMTSELEDRYTDLRFSPYGTAFMTDAIIVQRYIEVDSRLRRMMAVVKLRASPHSHELREFTIDATGLHIGEMLANQEGLLGGRPTSKSVGNKSVGSDGGDLE